MKMRNEPMDANFEQCLMPTLAKYHPQEDENGYESLEIKGAVQSSVEL